MKKVNIIVKTAISHKSHIGFVSTNIQEELEKKKFVVVYETANSNNICYIIQVKNIITIEYNIN